jgi:hypothetical protein
MKPSLKSPTPRAGSPWIYASLAVVDGQRRLKPAQVGPDHLLFTMPPHLTGEKIEIILQNGDEEHRSFADVLPHHPDATMIPIQLLPSH